MVRFQYVGQISPPAPFVYVTLANPETGLVSAEMPALVDSGGDRTVIPGKLVGERGLSPLRTIRVGGLGMDEHELNTYSLAIQIRQMNSINVEVAAHDKESYVLLGRDVLNQFRVLLDGPNRILEID